MQAQNNVSKMQGLPGEDCQNQSDDVRSVSDLRGAQRLVRGRREVPHRHDCAQGEEVHFHHVHHHLHFPGLLVASLHSLCGEFFAPRS